MAQVLGCYPGAGVTQFPGFHLVPLGSGSQGEVAQESGCQPDGHPKGKFKMAQVLGCYPGARVTQIPGFHLVPRGSGSKGEMAHESGCHPDGPLKIRSRWHKC